MFNPMVAHHHGAAIMACLGSLLGWQFTIAQTGKSAAEERMFPALFSKVNSLGAPVIGMIVLGILQTGLALMTISPSLSEQFGVLVSLAVVTNVIPYIIALSALPVMMWAAAFAATYRRNAVVILVAMLAHLRLYVGKMRCCGMIVTAIAFIIWASLHRALHRRPAVSTRTKVA
jgi:putrescine:ornithine antiporter